MSIYQLFFIVYALWIVQCIIQVWEGSHAGWAKDYKDLPCLKEFSAVGGVVIFWKGIEL